MLVGHLFAAALWWWLEPGGFPWGHPRFWINRVLPGLAVLWSSGSLASLHREDRRRLLIWLPVIPAAWLAAAISARLVFPITFAWIWLVPLGIALIMAAFLISICRHLTSGSPARFCRRLRGHRDRLCGRSHRTTAAAGNTPAAGGSCRR